MPLPASTPGPTSLPRVVSLSLPFYLLLCPSSIALFLLVLPLLRTFARRASKLFPSLARYNSLVDTTREKGSTSLPMYSRAKLYSIASRESHRRWWLRKDRHDGRKRLRAYYPHLGKRCHREKESRDARLIFSLRDGERKSIFAPIREKLKGLLRERGTSSLFVRSTL